MKREIKFRAWCESNNEMYSPDETHEFWFDNNSIGFYPRYDTHVLQHYNTIPAEHEKEIVVMQCTGLKDKNGKEIYEGDICLIFTDRPEPVIFSDGAFGYKDSTGYFISFAQNHWFKWTNSKSNEIEVIGNIFENPELLNP